MVEVGAGSEHVPGVEVVLVAVDVGVEVVVADELAQILGAHVVLLVAHGVDEVELVNPELVGHGHVAVVGDPLGDPVVAAHSLEPPYFIPIAEPYGVGLIGAILLQKRAQPERALAGGLHIGQDYGDEVFFSDAPGDFGNVSGFSGLALGGLEGDVGIGPKHPGVGGNGFSGGHGHIGRVDSGFAPHAVLPDGVWHAGVADGVIGELELDVAAYGLVVPGLVFRLHDDKLLDVEHPVGGVLVPGHNRGTVVAGVFTYEECSAWHIFVLFSRTHKPLSALLQENNSYLCVFSA